MVNPAERPSNPLHDPRIGNIVLRGIAISSAEADTAAISYVDAVHTALAVSDKEFDRLMGKQLSDPEPEATRQLQSY